MHSSSNRLRKYGWCYFFEIQLSETEQARTFPGRVTAVHRTGLDIVTEQSEISLPMAGKWFELPTEQRPTVGDWVLLDDTCTSIERLLGRKSLFKRMGAGESSEIQLIAANIDTLFVVSSCNDEFNLSRLERFLSLGLDASVETVVVLTKADLTKNPEYFVDEVRKLKSVSHLEVVNAIDINSLAALQSWCVEGQTIALLGSSGVGKSTLVNTLSNSQVQLTRSVRDVDKHGRHTTSHRSLHLLPGGGLILDSPGMREIQLADSNAGLTDVFDEIQVLAAQCKFSNCAHISEPGCRVSQGIAQGEIDARRLENYMKLQRELQHANESVAERHKRSRDRGKLMKQHLSTKARK
ncbi:MAG: ribosome small subunit-dependent GTPase A [Pseudomonadales bacterium]|nr:ribosome small subunit-dependent GTPase A [Pseudomonadales bacterium]